METRTAEQIAIDETIELIAAIRAIDNADGQISYGKLQALQDALKVADAVENVEA